MKGLLVVGVLVFALKLEYGKSDHVHLKIHVPDLVHKHKHVKTKYVHVYHPKVIHTDHHHSSLQFLHRHDPQPLFNIKKESPSKEYHISEKDFFNWRREQKRRAIEKRRQLQQKHNDDDNEDYEENADFEESEEDQPNYNDELYLRHKANKASSSSSRKDLKHKNHNYTSDRDYDLSNSDKVYARNRLNNRHKQNRSPYAPSIEEETIKKYRVYGVSNVDAESSNIEPKYVSLDPTAVDPGYYSTLKNAKKSSSEDDIYSGLLSKKYDKEIAEKSKLLGDINYNRKLQTKNANQQKSQK